MARSPEGDSADMTIVATSQPANTAHPPVRERTSHAPPRMTMMIVTKTTIIPHGTTTCPHGIDTISRVACRKDPMIPTARPTTTSPMMHRMASGPDARRVTR